MGRGIGRMAPAVLRLRFAGPNIISLSHSTRSKTFTVSWTSGSSSMPCKLQFYTGSAWTDISSTVSSPLNCGTTVVSQNVTLNGDGWKSNWNGTQVRILRIADSSVLGTFAQMLSCSTTGGSSSSTPNIDEDCNGSWDNSTSSNSCQTYSGCNAGQTCWSGTYWSGTTCSGTVLYNYSVCDAVGGVGQCSAEGGSQSYMRTGAGSGCSYDVCDTVYTYY